MTDKITKFIEGLDQKMKQRLKLKLMALKKNPFKDQNIKKLHGYEDTYRLRLGKIRVIYKIIEKEVIIIDIDFRGNIY